MGTISHPLLRLASRLLSFSRRTWIIISISVVLLIAVAIWMTIALASSLFAMARDGASAMPDVARTAIQHVEQALPGAGRALDDLRTIAQPAVPARDASGSDPVAVARFPGFIRTHWQREGLQQTVRYEGKADFASVLKHYTQDFSVLGYRQELNAATQSEERHDYVKSEERIRVTFSQLNDRTVSVSITARQPPSGP